MVLFASDAASAVLETGCGTKTCRRILFKDILEKVRELKWCWVGHVARYSEDRWTHRTSIWRFRTSRRGQRKLQRRWIDDITAVGGNDWVRSAQDQEAWKIRGEAHI